MRIDNFATAWELVADTVGERVAVVHGGTERTWSELEGRAARLAEALAALGVGHGTTVAVDLRNGIEALEVLFAAFKLRAVPFVVNYRFREMELTYLLEDAKPRVIVFAHELADRVLPAVERARVGVQAIEVSGGAEPPSGVLGFEALVEAHGPAARIARGGDDEHLIYTGGTTGAPKGVVWPHSSLIFPPVVGGRAADTVDAFCAAIGDPAAGAARLVLPPLMHAAGFFAATRALTTGGTVVFCASPHLDPKEVLGLVERYRVTGFSVIGDAIARPLLDEMDAAAAEGRPYDVSSVESIYNTGGIWSAAVKKGFLRHGRFRIVDSLNATEAGGFAVAEASEPEEIETARFRLGANARVLDSEGRDVLAGSGAIGTLATTGRLPKGYLNHPERTAATWPTINGVRYAIPGDLATVEADGTITLLGRGSEVINTGGEKVFVEEVESAILSHPSVQDALVVGLADERWGSRVTALVVARPGSNLTEQAVVDHVGQALADYKRPRQVVFVDKIPRSPSGKADRPSAARIAEQASKER